MSKNWYPVIDYDRCIDCGACSEKCTHGVYDKEMAPSPVVVGPWNCIEKCGACGCLCPVGAIAYSGDINMVSILNK